MLAENRRVRNFAFVFYVKSSPMDWEMRLRDLHLSGYYIYHDKDLNGDDSPKEPHIHVLIITEGLYTISKLKRLAIYVGGEKTIYQEVNSLKGYARYLCHLDDPEKYRYELKEVRNMGECNYEDYVNPDAKSLKIATDIIKFCRDNQVYVYADLIDYCMDNQSEWFKFLCSKQQGRIILEYMKSRYWSNTRFNSLGLAPERSEGSKDL